MEILIHQHAWEYYVKYYVFAANYNEPNTNKIFR